MIEYLHIRDMAIIDRLEVEFSDGFNVITGETGAGKSILVQALSLLRGGRATSQLVRSGAESATVEAVFRPPDTPGARALMAGAGLEGETELSVSRLVTAGGKGKGRVRICGELSSVTVLARLVSGLVDLTGQNEQQSLSVKANHRSIVDGYGVKEPDRRAMREAYELLKDVMGRMDSVPIDSTERAARMDFLQHQIEELEAARIQPGEEERLETDRKRLASATDLENVARSSMMTLYDEAGSVNDRLSQVIRSMDDWTSVEPLLGELAERLEDARAVCEDAASDLRRYADGIESDPERLSQVEERILLLAGLKRKHGCAALSDLLDHAEEMTRELSELGRFDQKMASFHRQLEQARQQAAQTAAAVGRARKRAARRLLKAVESGLEELGMKGTRFQISVEDVPRRPDDDARLCWEDRRLTASGWDRVEMTVSPNPGEPLRSVSQIASGGELSRILLAFKSAMARTDSVGAYVFDEVDSGIGGAQADVVGRKLAQAAAHRQVLCVTHIPQIAAYADHHYVVAKKVARGRARSVIRALDQDERVEELARMVGGRKVTKQARQHALSLLRQAGR